MNLPDCTHGTPFGSCTSCMFLALQAAWRTNAGLNRRIQQNEGAAGKLDRMKRTLRTLEATLGERKVMLDMLGIAWSTRGAMSREGELTIEQVKLLVQTVNRIQRRFHNTEYRLEYSNVDEMVRQQLERLQKAWVEKCDEAWKLKQELDALKASVPPSRTGEKEGNG